MVMRVPNSVSDQITLFNINRINADIMKVQEQLTTGKKLLRPQDDPAGSYLSVKYRSYKFRLDKYMETADLVKDEMTTVDGIMDQMTVVLRRIKDLTLYASNGTMAASDREAVLEEVEQLRQQMMSLANSQYKGKYVFAGGNFFTQPFSEVEHNNLKEVNFTGDESKLEEKISDDETIIKNISGINLFYKPIERDTKLSDLNQGAGLNLGSGEPVSFKVTEKDGTTYTVSLNALVGNSDATVGDLIDLVNSQLNNAQMKISNSGNQLMIVDNSAATKSDLIVENDTSHNVATQLGLDKRSNTGKVKGNLLQPYGSVFSTIYRLEDALKANDQPKIYTGLVSEFNYFMDRISTARSQLGARVNRATLTKQRLDNLKLSMEDMVSKIEDVDLSEAAMKLQRLQVSQKLALQVGANIMRLTLMDYLR